MENLVSIATAKGNNLYSKQLVPWITSDVPTACLVVQVSTELFAKTSESALCCRSECSLSFIFSLTTFFTPCYSPLCREEVVSNDRYSDYRSKDARFEVTSKVGWHKSGSGSQ